MASFALPAIYSGYKFDMANKVIGFEPIANSDDFSAFWSVENASQENEINILVEDAYNAIMGLE